MKCCPQCDLGVTVPSLSTRSSDPMWKHDYVYLNLDRLFCQCLRQVLISYSQCCGPAPTCAGPKSCGVDCLLGKGSLVMARQWGKCLLVSTLDSTGVVHANQNPPLTWERSPLELSSGGFSKACSGAAIVPHNFKFEELILEITSTYLFRSFYYPAALPSVLVISVWTRTSKVT